MKLSDAEANDILDHVFSEFPREACGLILDHRSGLERPRLLRARNVQDLLRVLDQALPPATEAYAVDPTTLLEAGAMVRMGWRIAVIYHSHTNGALGLSERDRTLAVAYGQPLYPNTVYLLVSLATVAQPSNGLWQSWPTRRAFRMSAWAWNGRAWCEELIEFGGVENLDRTETHGLG